MRSPLPGQKSEDKGPENQSQEPSHTSTVINTQKADKEADNSLQGSRSEDERRRENTGSDKERRGSLQERAKRLIEDTKLMVDNSRTEIANTFSKISPISTNPSTGFQDNRNDRISRNPSAGMFFICVSPFSNPVSHSHSPHVIIVLLFLLLAGKQCALSCNRSASSALRVRVASARHYLPDMCSPVCARQTNRWTDYRGE